MALGVSPPPPQKKCDLPQWRCLTGINLPFSDTNTKNISKKLVYWPQSINNIFIFNHLHGLNSLNSEVYIYIHKDSWVRPRTVDEVPDNVVNPSAPLLFRRWKKNGHLGRLQSGRRWLWRPKRGGLTRKMGIELEDPGGTWDFMGLCNPQKILTWLDFFYPEIISEKILVILWHSNYGMCQSLEAGPDPNSLYSSSSCQYSTT